MKTRAMAKRCAAVLGLFPPLAAWAGVVVSHETVALTGTDGTYGPGLGTGINFTFLTIFPTINNSGEVAIQGNTNTGGSVDGSNNGGIWLGTPGAMVAVVRKGDDADGFTIASLGGPQLAHDGTICFGGTASGTSTIMQYTGDALDPVDIVLRGGTPAPGGGNFNNNPGNQRYTEGDASILTSAGGLAGIWAGGPATLGMVAKMNEIAPGFGTATYNNAFDLPRVGGGQSIFSDTASGAGVTPGVDDSGLWVGAPGAVSLLARRNVTDAPGAGEKFGNVVGRNYSINNAATVAFATVTVSGRKGVWLGTPGSLAKVALEDEQAADLPTGITYDLFRQVLINGDDDVAFIAQLNAVGDPDADAAIFVGDENGLSLVVQEGDVIDGVRFDFNVAEAASLSFSAGNDLVFTARKDNTVNDGLFAFVDGLLKVIAVEGELFDVDPGPGVDNRTISVVRGPADGSSGFTPVQSGGQDGGYRFLNDHGQFVHRMDFTDGSHGVFLTTIAAPCAWDCDGSGDGAVGVTDLLALLGQYDPMSPVGCTGGACDFNGDGCVDVVDLLKLLGHYDPAGAGCP